MPATLCKAMYLSAVMKMPSSRGSCTSRWYPHFSHASDIHWRGSELVVMPTSFQNLARWGHPLARRVGASEAKQTRAGQSDHLPRSCETRKGNSASDSRHRAFRYAHTTDVRLGRGQRWVCLGLATIDASR
jgi:hypothetical protein